MVHLTVCSCHITYAIQSESKRSHIFSVTSRLRYNRPPWYIIKFPKLWVVKQKIICFITYVFSISHFLQNIFNSLLKKNFNVSLQLLVYNFILKLGSCLPDPWAFVSFLNDNQGIISKAVYSMPFLFCQIRITSNNKVFV